MLEHSPIHLKIKSKFEGVLGGVFLFVGWLGFFFKCVSYHNHGPFHCFVAFPVNI